MIKKSKQLYLSSIFSIDKVEAALLVTVCFLLFIYSGNAATLANRSTNSTGSWNTPGIWTGSTVPVGADNVTVNHALALNASLSPTASYIFNAPVTDATGGTAFTITVSGGGTLEIKANTVIEGALTINSGGKLIIRTGYTLTVGAATFTSGGTSSILIEDGATLIVNGLFTNNNANVEIDGDVKVNGKISTGGSSVIYGTGTVATTISGTNGSTTNNGTIFGNGSSCSSGTCSFVSPCNSAATQASISAPEGICTGASVTISSSVASGIAPSYQWQSSTNGTTFANVPSGGTGSTYTASPTVTTYYQLKVTYSANAGGCSYTTDDDMVSVYGKSTVPTSSTGTTTICSGSSATLGVSGGTLASDASAVWYQGACPGFTEDWAGTSNSYTVRGATVNRVGGGAMTISVTPGTGPSNPTDPWIEMFSTGTYNPATYKYIKVRYRVNSGTPGNIQIYYIKNTPSALTVANEYAVVVSSALVADGNWNIVTIDMSQSANWATNSVTGWRFDFATEVCNMDIDYIMLTASPAVSNPVSPTAPITTTTTNYFVRYEGLCASTNCPGTGAVTVTVNPAPISAAGTAVTTCSNSGAVSITAGSSGTNRSAVAWTASGGGTLNNPNSLTSASYVPTDQDKTDGSVTLTLTVTGTTGACINTTAVSTKTLTIFASPTATAGGSQTICQSTAGTVSGASSSNGTIAWTHNGAGSITSGGTTTTPVYTAAAADGGNTVTLTMTVSNSNCPSTNATYSMLVSTCARAWTGASSTAWTVNTNWSPSIVPTSIDDITIPSSVASGKMPFVSTSTNVRSISNSGTLTITGSGTLNTYGNISNTGTFTAASGSTLAFKGNTAQTMTGVPALYNVTVANTSGGVSLSSAVTVKGALTLTSGVLTTNSNLTINFDNGGFIAYNATDAGSISGNVSGRRDAIARTHYIAAPFNGVTSNQVSATAPLFYNGYWKMYKKNFDNQGWTAVMDETTSMGLGSGFSLAMPAAAPLIFTGTYNHNYSYTGTSYSNAAATKYILIGNPYPGALDWTSAGWTKTNVADAVYYWNASSNSAASYIAGVGTNGGTQYIPAMQSFMVTTTGSGGNSSVSISNAARVNLQNPSYFRTSSDGIIRIKLASGANADQWDDAVVRFTEDASTSFDNDWDAYKIVSPGPNPLVYTTLKGQVYSINSVSGVDSLPTVDVVVYLPSSGNYRLSVANNDPTIDYVLIDKKLGTDNVLPDSGYVFTGSPADATNRFALQLRTAQTTGVQTSTASQGLQILSSTKGFVLQTNQFGGAHAAIELLDMTGNSVQTLNNMSLSSGSTYVPMDLSSGAYLVKVTVDGNVFTGMISLVR